MTSAITSAEANRESSRYRVVVKPTQRDRIDVEEQPQIVIADVVEVPAGPDVPSGAGIAHDAGLPLRVMDGNRDLVGHVGEGQTLRREADLSAPGILRQDGNSR